MTDEKFDCNRVVVTFAGEVRVSVVRGSGKHRRVHRESRVIVHDTLLLSEAITIPQGDTAFDFQFALPEAAPCTYHGYRADIGYSIEGKAEVSWAIDLWNEVEILVVATVPILTPQNLTGSIHFAEMTEIIIENPSDILTPERPFVVKCMVRGDPNIRGLRFEVIHHATRIARGRDGKTDYDLYRLEVPRDQLSFNSWQEIPLNFDTSMLAEIQMDILQVYYTPKVTADIPWRLDKSIEFPLRVGRLAPESDPFGFVEF